MPLITALAAARPTYGYRRITALLNRRLRSEGLEPVNHKRAYRVMKVHNLLLARKYSERPEHVHDGKVIVMRSNLRWCSDGFEFTCWNGDIIRAAFIIDAHDREIIAWRAVVNAGISVCGCIWTPPDCNILGSGSAVTIADVYPASSSGPECPSPRAPMDFRALLPQCPRDIGVRRAGPHIRLKKRWDRSLSPSLPGCCNVPGFAFVLSGLRPSRSAHRDGLLGPIVLLSRQNRPDDPGVLVGKGDGDHVGVSPFTHPADPQTFRIAFPVGFAEDGARAMDHQCSDVTVSAFADPKQPSLAAA